MEPSVIVQFGASCAGTVGFSIGSIGVSPTSRRCFLFRLFLGDSRVGVETDSNTRFVRTTLANAEVKVSVSGQLPRTLRLSGRTHSTVQSMHLRFLLQHVLLFLCLLIPMGAFSAKTPQFTSACLRLTSPFAGPPLSTFPCSLRITPLPSAFLPARSILRSMPLMKL